MYFLFQLTDTGSAVHSYTAGEEQHYKPVVELDDKTASGPEI